MRDLDQKNKLKLKQDNLYNLSQELHPSFCSCNACSNSKDTNFPNEENSYSSSKKTGTSQELGDYIRTAWDIDNKFIYGD